MVQTVGPYKRANPALKRVLGFFVAKGFLIVPGIDPLHSEKLDIDEVIKFGLKYEPRIIEVLPAALLHFPKSFVNWGKIPDVLKQVLDAIRSDLNDGPELAGIDFKAMKRWANRKLPDGRVVPQNEQKILKSFRLAPEILQKLRRHAKESERSETEILEGLVFTHL